MKTKLINRLRSKSGESIAEVLVALLIAALSLTMLAVMISSTVRMVETGKAKMTDYYDANAKIELQKEPDGKFNLNIKSETDNKLKFTEENVNYYENTVFNNSVYSYQK